MKAKNPTTNNNKMSESFSYYEIKKDLDEVVGSLQLEGTLRIMCQKEIKELKDKIISQNLREKKIIEYYEMKKKKYKDRINELEGEWTNINKENKTIKKKYEDILKSVDCRTLSEGEYMDYAVMMKDDFKNLEEKIKKLRNEKANLKKQLQHQKDLRIADLLRGKTKP